MSRVVLPLFLLLLAGACGPAMSTTRLGPVHAPRTAQEDVRIYSVQNPDCAFEEVALVTVEQPAWPANWFNPNRSLTALRERAGRLGGDAIVGLTQLPPSEGFMGGLSGTVVRFQHDACRA